MCQCKCRIAQKLQTRSFHSMKMYMYPFSEGNISHCTGLPYRRILQEKLRIVQLFRLRTRPVCLYRYLLRHEMRGIHRNFFRTLFIPHKRYKLFRKLPCMEFPCYLGRLEDIRQNFDRYLLTNSFSCIFSTIVLGLLT